MKGKFLLVCAITLTTLPCWAQLDLQPSPANDNRGTPIDAKKEADIRRMMELTGAGALGMQVMKNMESSVRPMMEDTLPPGAYRDKLIDLFFQKFHAQATQESLVDLVVPIYDRHFSDEEVKQLIAFYESPIGKKAVSELPQIVTESQQAGGAWGRDLGRKCMQEVLSEHPELAEAMAKAQHPTPTRPKKAPASH